jgi:tRNA (guanine-N7-)-methyltransferase
MRVERTRFMQQNQIHSRFHKITMGGQGRQMTKSADDIASQAQGAGHGSFFGRRKAQASQSSDRPDGASAAAAHADLAAADASDPAALFDAPVSELRLEIGFGGGEHLAAEALAYPQTGFIGCEPYINGMAKILSLIEANNITNIRLYAGDAAELLAWAQASSFRRIDLIHPDPWPKRRHWKRRFVQDATIMQMSRILDPAGEFRFVSDIDDYCSWTLMHMQRAQRFYMDGRTCR